MMRSNVVLILLAFLVDGVFGDTEAVKSVSLMEGDTVTLYTDVTKQHHDTMLWYFNDIRIALINGGPSKSCVYDGEGGRFRDRLKVDYETGSLIITDIRSDHVGRYEAELIRSNSSGKSESLNRPRKCNSTKIIKKNSNSGDIIKRFSLTLSGVFGDTEAVKSVSLMEGDTVTLYTNVTKRHHDMLWYFNDIRIVLIDGGPSKSCLYDGEGGRFRDRLKVDYETGSLIITDIRSDHVGRYEAELIRSNSSGKSESLNRTSKCNSTKIIKKNSNSEDIIKRFSLTVSGVFGDTEAVKSVSVMEGDTVTLYTNVTKQQHDTMLWYFNDIRIALINGDPSTSCVYDGESGRFRDRLKVDYETGSLIITDIRSDHVGRYEAELIRSNSSGKSESLNRPRKCDSTKIIKKNSNSEYIIKRFSLTLSGSGLYSGVVAGIVVVGVVGVVLLVAAAVVGCRKIDRCIFRNVKEKPTIEVQVSMDEIQNERSLMI